MIEFPLLHVSAKFYRKTIVLYHTRHHTALGAS